MKTLLSLVVMTSALLLPFASQADDFDITMDVVAADESFDEVIVNRIALPFAASSDRQSLGDEQTGSSFTSQAVDGVVDAVDQPIDESGVSDGLDVESVVQDRELPVPADLGLRR